ncbi:MAG: hypothetical protein OIN88_13000 [Candidatus Methanoperedens sp.]|nr:hypothetical protein [Candidatus Methanoperedens sp.]
MNVRISLFLLIILIGSANAQEAISEHQVLLNGYVDSSGKVLLTGYATPESLSYMPFLNGIKYSFDNNTNQLYAVTDMLTSKKGDTWSLNFSLDGYYSDYSVTFYLPPGSEITRFELQPKLNYQFQVKDDSLTLSINGYRVVSPWINVEYKLPVDVPDQPGAPSVVSSLLIILMIAGGAFAFYRHRMHKRTVALEEKESREQEKKTIPETMLETKPEIKEIRITGEMQKVIDTLSEKEKAIILLLLRNGGSATQADIRYRTGIPRSSLTGMINALKRRNLIKKHEYGRTNVIELSEWFLLENERK